MEKKFKLASYKLLAFTLIAQLFAIFITKIFYSSPLAEEAYEPFGNTVEGAIANSLPLIASIFIFGFFLAFLVKWKKFSFIKALVTGFLIGSVFSINIILFSTIFPESILLPWFFSILLVCLVFLVAYSKTFYFLSKFLSLFIGAEIAGYFSTILQPPTVFVFPLLLAIYDIYAVFAGPLKRILGKPIKAKKVVKIKIDFLPLLIVDFDLIKIGLGDVVFYSMLPATAFMLFGLQKMLLTLVATNLGVLITIYLLRKKRIPLPGLPIPMFLGVLSLLF
jgi:presenilin-like A22 family membrane protease